MSDEFTYADLLALNAEMSKALICVLCGDPATWYDLNDIGAVRNYCDSCVGKSQAPSVHRRKVGLLD